MECPFDEQYPRDRMIILISVLERVGTFVTRFRVCFYDITDADKSEAKINKAFSYTLEGKTLTTLRISGGTRPANFISRRTVACSAFYNQTLQQYYLQFHTNLSNLKDIFNHSPSNRILYFIKNFILYDKL